MLDIGTSCRTCMKDDVKLVDLYEMVKIEDNCHQLADLLVVCTAIQVSKDDGLPQKLCDECARIIQVAYSFRNLAEKSQEQFKQLLHLHIKSEPQEFKPKTENDLDYLDSYDDFGINYDFTPTSEHEEQLKCTKCNKTFINEKKFTKHMQMHEFSLQCTFCSKSYLNQVSLNKHVLAKHLKPYSCAICNQNFETEPLLLEHTSEHNANDTKVNVEVTIKAEAPNLTKSDVQPPEAHIDFLKCPDCDLSFTKRRSLALHLRKHRNKQTEFICDACGKVFSTKQRLKRHILLHSQVKPHICDKCSKSFARKDQLVHHMYKHKDSRPYKCSYCKKGFIQLCSLKDHIRSHTGETPYLCSECGKGFTNSSNLRQHMMRHTGLKPYACNMCPKTFCTKGQMTSHMSTHTGGHPHKCEECGAAFTKQSSLKKHSMIHLGIRPFACDTCNMRFTCKDHLKRHYRIHTGEKPYRCSYCERAFSQSNDLVKHTRAHVGQKTYQCTICGVRFRLMSELKAHYPIHFVDGKLQPPVTRDNDLRRPTQKDIDALILRPADLPMLSPIKDMPILPMQPKDMPLLLKPDSPVDLVPLSEINEDKNRYTITINSCDKNGLVNGITINIPAKDSQDELV